MNLSGIVKDFIGYGGSILCKRVLLYGLAVIISARILGPESYGLWVALSLIIQYGEYAHLGIGNALVREVAFYRGKKDLSQINRVRNTSFSLIFLASLLLGSFIFLFSLIFFNHFEKRIIQCVRLIAIILILQQLYEYFRRYFTSMGNFKLVSKLVISLALLVSFFTVIFIKRLNIIGIPLAWTLSYTLVLGYLSMNYKINIKPTIDTNLAIHLIKIGFPIMAASAIYELFITVEQIYIFRYFGKLNLGYYSITVAILNFLMLYSLTFSDIVYVNLSKLYGATNSIGDLREFVTRTTIWLAHTLAIFCVLAYEVVPYVIKLFLPQYIPGISIFKLSIIGIFFLNLCVISIMFLFVINKQKYYFLFIISGLICKIILIHFLITRYKDITAMIICSIILYFIFSNSIIIYSFLHFKEKTVTFFRFFNRLYVFPVLAFFIIFSLDYHIHNNTFSFNHMLSSLLVVSFFIVLLFKYIFTKSSYSLNSLNNE